MLTPWKADSKQVFLIMGWGNTLRDQCLTWLKQKAEEQNWSLMVIEIPCEYSDFSLVLEEIKTLIGKFNWDVMLFHSMGAIFGRYINLHNNIQRVFLSPFWKIPRRTLILKSYTVSRFCISLLSWWKTPVLNRNFQDEDIGQTDLPQDVPQYISPSTMWQVMKAQENMPPLTKNDTIIFCPTDKVIDTSICSGITYNGGHYSFTVKERDDVFRKIVNVLAP